MGNNSNSFSALSQNSSGFESGGPLNFNNGSGFQGNSKLDGEKKKMNFKKVVNPPQNKRNVQKGQEVGGLSAGDKGKKPDEILTNPFPTFNAEDVNKSNFMTFTAQNLRTSSTLEIETSLSKKQPLTAPSQVSQEIPFNGGRKQANSKLESFIGSGEILATFGGSEEVTGFGSRDQLLGNDEAGMDCAAALPTSLPGAAQVTGEGGTNLLEMVSIEEIHEVVKSLSPHKVPGPDGCQTFFYQKFWPTVGESVFKVVKEAFESGGFHEDVGRTYLCLIPKKPNPSCVTHFRPISLCNVLYKIVTKTIVKRVKPYISELVSPMQSSFIPGKGTQDNILCLQEIIHSFRNSKCKKGNIVIKIDLEKAYDKVSWDFLEQTLYVFNFPRQLINLIMHCVTSSSPQILWNGMALPPLKPKYGLRQGDLLSPYLFVLCMERLSHLIEATVRERNWQPIQPCRGGPKFSHLFFADDLILFTKTSHDNAQKIKDILDSFCTHSGHLVNKHKSKIFFSKSVGNRCKRDLANCLEMSSTNNLGKYLGVPILHERVKTSTSKEVIDRILSMLTS
ncbi:hypothetical protein BUALT_Bualt04G0026600 [Buddleja alternifolia]|uniref:Reverse transcriptase domain-containing protein n=1 Tax=Buddleja alternifolia TaxID=168488 RepID=A0AAV6XMP8_9LAMI|nr:hypothetical protein BUALT_Bualt04G0026600 [Buddleja alternifolia]